MGARRRLYCFPKHLDACEGAGEVLQEEQLFLGGTRQNAQANPSADRELQAPSVRASTEGDQSFCCGSDVTL